MNYDEEFEIWKRYNGHLLDRYDLQEGDNYYSNEYDERLTINKLMTKMVDVSVIRDRLPEGDWNRTRSHRWRQFELLTYLSSGDFNLSYRREEHKEACTDETIS